MLLCLSQLVTDVRFIHPAGEGPGLHEEGNLTHSEKQQAATRDNENLKGEVHWEVLPVKW